MRWPAVLGLLAVAGILVGGALVLEPRADPAPPTDPGADRAFVAEDSSGNGHDGVVVGSPRLGAPGRTGSSYGFGRAGAWVLVPSSEELNPGTKDFMYSAWVQVSRIPEPGQSFDVLRKGLSYTAGGEYKLEVVRGGSIRCTITDAQHTRETVEKDFAEIADGRWHHLACARTGSRLSLLVDGTLESVPASLGHVSNSMPLALGSKYGSEDQVEGRIDEVTLWVSRAGRSSDPVSAAVAMEELQEQRPVAQWHLDETT